MEQTWREKQIGLAMDVLAERKQQLLNTTEMYYSENCYSEGCYVVRRGFTIAHATAIGEATALFHMLRDHEVVECL